MSTIGVRNTGNSNGNYFPALTGIRAIAAYLVFFHHYNPFGAERFGIFLNQFVQELHIGVSIFFVLSGFLITHRYFFESATFSWRTYIVNRLARVYPMYFIITTLTFMLAAEPSWFVYLLNITFLRGFFNDVKFTLISQGWSLTVEECFYLLAPVFFLILRKTKYAWFALPVFLVGIGAMLVSLFGSRTELGFFQNHSFMFIYTFFGRCFEFLCGMGLALCFKHPLRQKYSCTWIGCVMVIITVAVMSFLGNTGVSGVQSNMGIVMNNFLLPVAVCVLFYGLITEQNLLVSLFSSRMFILLGKSSYTFYLIHLGILATWIENIVSGNIILVFIMLNCLAIVLWRLVEEPLNKWVRKMG